MAPKFCHLLVVFLLVYSVQIAASSRSLKSLTDSQNYFQKLLGIQKGQNMKEVIGLKKYLKTYGYYHVDSNLTEEFDDLVESALKTYQRFYHLNVTGILDSNTMNDMMKPRCGVADIIYHHSTKPAGHQGNHDHKLGKFHIVAHYTFFDGQPKWSRYDLTYTFQSGVEVISLETLRQVCQRAFQTWAGVSQFKFREAAAGEKSDISIGFYRGDHGDGSPFDGPSPYGPTLAHAFAPEKGLFHYDADESWSTNPTSSQFDLESVATHEIGHLLGLGHSQDQAAVMYSQINAGATKRNLNQDDINGITALYSN